MGKWVQEYIVTLKDYNELNQFYQDMETDGSDAEFVPSRSVQCTYQRPVSRNTHYLLTTAEARLLKNDHRVESISVFNNNFKKTKFSERSGVWDRGTAIDTSHNNWGLYRMQLPENDTSWGSEAGDSARVGTVKINGTGKNVDIVVVDEVIYPGHSEFSGRVVEYDWFRQHDIAVRGSDTNITNIRRTLNVATITTQTPHRLTEGFIIDVVCTTDNTFNVSAATITNIISDTEFQYNNPGPSVTSTLADGFWRGVYQYPDYTGSNNHATAVAGIIAGTTQGWATGANIYNLRNDSYGWYSGEYTPPDLLIDYIRQFHANKPVNPETGRRNPTLVNNSWGFTTQLSFLENSYTGNPSYSKIVYRGSVVSPASAPVDTGISGVFSNNSLLGEFPTVEGGYAFSVTTDSTTATIIPIPFTETGNASLTNLGAPDGVNNNGIDVNDDALWQLSLPFPISYLGSNYQSNLYLSSNSFISLGGFFNGYPEFSATYPAMNKIYISAGDRNVENVWEGTFGTAPNRTHVIRFEGWDGAFSSLYGTENNLIWEVVFYEATPARIDVRFINNAVFRSEFTTQEVQSYGVIVDGAPTPVRIPSIDADISDAINEGIIFVGAAGNSSSKIDVPSGVDYDNYIVDNGDIVYYHRGSSPANSHPDLICVGSLDSVSQESKADTSNTGPGVDLYAPGVNILTSVFDQSGQLSDLVTKKHLTFNSGFAGTASILATEGVAAVVTDDEHGLSTGDIITIDDCSNFEYNVTNAEITVVSPNTISFAINNASYSSSSDQLTGTLKVGGLLQKWSDSSLAAAQVSGLLALALEYYPNMKQADAKQYILNYAKNNLMFSTQGSYSDSASLQGGANAIAYYHKERADAGALVPRTNQWIRPAAGQVYPRPIIRRR